MKYEDKEFDVDLVDDGTLDTVISINGREFRFDCEYAAEYRDEETGELGEESLEVLASEALDDMEEEDFQQLLEEN